MKCMNKAIALFLLSIQILTIVLSKATPKASDLSNHYGTEATANKYGPNHATGVNLRREGAGPGAPVTPITNFSSEINPAAVTAGDLNNTAFDASRIIKASIASPKVEIKSKIHHEAVVKTPVHLGNQIEEKVVNSFNRMNGKVESTKVTVDKPILGLVNEARIVETDHTTVVDAATGKLVVSNPDIKLHGN